MINLLETNNGNNDGKYSNPEFDALVEKARTTADKEEHYKLLHEAENMLLEDRLWHLLPMRMTSGYRARN